MFPLLALIPGLLYTGAKVVGPLIEDHATAITKGILALTSKTPIGKEIADVFSAVLGNVDEQKKTELQLQLQSYIDQTKINELEQTESLFDRGWRPALAWVLAINIGIHYTIVNVIDIINCVLKYLDYDKVAQIAPMDAMTLSLMTGLLGLYISARTYEKAKGVN